MKLFKEVNITKFSTGWYLNNKLFYPDIGLFLTEEKRILLLKEKSTGRISSNYPKITMPCKKEIVIIANTPTCRR